MSFINEKTKEINLKIVYYGPALCGKSTTLRSVFSQVQTAGELVSLSQAGDSTLYFDFVPINLGKIKDYTIRLHLYTVPGEVGYESARKLISKGIDGVVFIADSQLERMESNLKSMVSLREIIKNEGFAVNDIPMVLQYNKRDLPNAVPVTEMHHLLNPNNIDEFETVATEGRGVLETLKTISRKVLLDLKRQSV